MTTPTLPPWVGLLCRIPKWGLWAALVLAGASATETTLTDPEFLDGTKGYKATALFTLVLLWGGIALLYRWTERLWTCPVRRSGRTRDTAPREDEA